MTAPKADYEPWNSRWEFLCQYVEDRAYERRELAKGMCPWSGLRLHQEGEGLPNTLSCDMCDCFGFDPKEVGVR